MAHNNAPRTITTDREKRELLIERTFDAPRALMWKVWTTPEHIARWWPPFGFTIPVCTIDLRPGGLWHYCMRSPDGQEHWVKSLYREIDAPARIVYTTVFADEHANTVEGLPEQLATVTFVENKDKTTLLTRIQFASETDLQAALDMNMAEGLTNTWKNLDKYLEELQEPETR